MSVGGIEYAVVGTRPDDRDEMIGIPIHVEIDADDHRLPVAHPRRVAGPQCTVDPPCFQSGFTNSSCAPGAGSLSAITYSNSPIGPMYNVIKTNLP